MNWGSTGSDISSSDWLVRLARLSKQTLSLETEFQLCKLDLQSMGEFRGLRNAVFRVMLGSSVEEASRAEAAELETTAAKDDWGSHLLTVFGRTLQSSSLSRGWRSIVSAGRKRSTIDWWPAPRLSRTSSAKQVGKDPRSRRNSKICFAQNRATNLSKTRESPDPRAPLADPTDTI